MYLKFKYEILLMLCYDPEIFKCLKIMTFNQSDHC